MIDPFNNNHQSQQIGQLIIENQTDKITIYGDIDIGKNEMGLAQAKQLQQLFNSIVNTLNDAKTNDAESFDNDNNDGDNDNNDIGASDPKMIKNPFL